MGEGCQEPTDQEVKFSVLRKKRKEKKTVGIKKINSQIKPGSSGFKH